MKVYESLDLKGNVIRDFNPVLRTDGTTEVGGLKYAVTGSGDTTAGELWLYTGSGEGQGWKLLASSTPGAANNGTFTITPGGFSSAVLDNTNGISVTVDNNNNNAGTNLLFGMNNGKLTIANGTTNSNRYITVDIADNIAGQIVYKKEFTIAQTGQQHVSIKNPFNSPYIIVSVYEVSEKPDVPSKYTKVLCDVGIGKSNDATPIDIIQLSFNGQTANTKYLLVVVGTQSATDIPAYNQSQGKDVSFTASSNLAIDNA